MQITPELLDEAIQGNLNCAKLVNSRACYTCKIHKGIYKKAKYFYISIKDPSRWNNTIIISFCSNKCKNKIGLNPTNIELSEKDLFYIKLKGE